MDAAKISMRSLKTQIKTSEAYQSKMMMNGIYSLTVSIRTKQTEKTGPERLDSQSCTRESKLTIAFAKRPKVHTTMTADICAKINRQHEIFLKKFRTSSVHADILLDSFKDVQTFLDLSIAMLEVYGEPDSKINAKYEATKLKRKAYMCIMCSTAYEIKNEDLT
jgi:hypothetical protein